ncbi:MAG: carboxypeptidase-like regulatory domain-containing protein [Candidatus Solibacter sp.]|nr:carboxypeptidase-like regulatory domain-containing protein [Candidatus Solibacter sp.]
MKLTVVVLMALLGLAGLIYGQAIDANLVGTVVDASGAAVPNASIDIQHVSTGVKTTTKTNADGQYRLNNIPIGIYNVTATAAGFATATLRNVDIQLSKTSTANIALQIGSVSTSVDVSEVGVVIDTTTAQLQSNFEARQIVNLPIIENANSLFGALNLSLLSSGVSSNGGVGQGTGPSVGGQRPMNNNFMIEGVDNNNKTVTGPLVYVPTEATAEFTLLQNQVGAEFGHSSGGQFNTVIKSGANQMHGSLYEYFQNRNLNAVDAVNAKPPGRLGGRRADQGQAVLLRHGGVCSAGRGQHGFDSGTFADGGGFRLVGQDGGRSEFLEDELLDLQAVCSRGPRGHRQHEGERRQHSDWHPADFGRQLHQLLELPGKRGFQHVVQRPDSRTFHHEPFGCAG